MRLGWGFKSNLSRIWNSACVFVRGGFIGKVRFRKKCAISVVSLERIPFAVVSLNGGHSVFFRAVS